MQAQLFARGGEATTAHQACARPACRQSHRHRRCELHAAAVEAPSTQQPFRQQHGRIYNFSAGPACLPQAVLEQAQAELLNWRGSGMSVMEMSHRGKEFVSILEQSVADLRELLQVPDNYKIFYVQGGGTGQFAGVPLNLTKPGDTVDHFVTGSWSKKAAQEAGKYQLNVNIAGKGDGKSIPEPSTWHLNPAASYVHYCDNETISGVEFKEVPDVPTMLVADMSSSFCSKPVDVSKYGVIYAGAQKNIGPAGATIMIVREDLLGKHRPETPSVMEYSTMSDSLFNTPPCYPIYMCGLVFAHMKAQGGIPAYFETNQRKAQHLYDAIDNSGGFYNSPVAVKDRSLMNVAFTIPQNADLEKSFVSQAAKEGMVQLKGHRSVGGMRASIYNAMPEEGVNKLIAFMKDFATSNQ